MVQSHTPFFTQRETMQVEGILAALAAPLTMTLGFIVWDNHWRGSAFSLNLFKCNLASFGFLTVVLSVRTFDPSLYTGQTVGYLFLSSTIGILIGDWTWLEALQLLGARRVILVDSTKPFLAAFLGALILGENFENSQWEIIGGILLTVVGVGLVSTEKERQAEEKSHTLKEIPKIENPEVENEDDDHLDVEENSSRDKDRATTSEQASELPFEEPKRQEKHLRRSINASAKDLRKGFFLATLNVILDTYGSLLTKQHGSQLNTWEISLLRFGFAGAVMFLVSSCLWLAEQLRKKPRAAENDDADTPWYVLPSMPRRDWGFVVGGVSLVTFVTPALSNYALFEIALALALTLGSIGPLYALPLSWLLQKQRPSSKAWLGSVLAVSGVVFLAFRGKTVE